MRGSRGSTLRAKGNGRSLVNNVVAALLAAGSAVAFGQTYITPTTPGWSFSEETPVATGGFVTGPGVPPTGSPGSYQISVEQPGGGLFYTQQYAGTPITKLSGLRYNTYIVSSVAPVTITMSFDFDDDLTVPTAAYGGRAVFDPGLVGSPALEVGKWQSWDPMTQRGWWGSGTPGTRPLNMYCTQAAPCTLAEIIGYFPNGGVLSDLFKGFFGFKLGNGGGPSQASVDGFSIGTAGHGGPVQEFRFAPHAPVPAAPVPALGNLGLLLLAAVLGVSGFAAMRRRT